MAVRWTCKLTHVVNLRNTTAVARSTLALLDSEISVMLCASLAVAWATLALFDNYCAAKQEVSVLPAPAASKRC